MWTICSMFPLTIFLDYIGTGVSTHAYVESLGLQSCKKKIKPKDVSNACALAVVPGMHQFPTTIFQLLAHRAKRKAHMIKHATFP